MIFVQADATEVDAIAGCIAAAFHPLAVADWLVPDRSERMRVLRDNFRIHVEHAVAYGEVWTTVNHTGAAVWAARDGAPAPGIADYDRRLSAACGPYVDRFRVLDDVFERHHPTAPHHHLAFLAVHPTRQRSGVGSALLAEHHLRLDLDGVPAYLEASSIEVRRLYLRHGYLDHGPSADLPDGPRLWPMWREPR